MSHDKTKLFQIKTRSCVVTSTINHWSKNPHVRYIIYSILEILIFVQHKTVFYVLFFETCLKLVKSVCEWGEWFDSHVNKVNRLFSYMYVRRN